MSDLNGPPPESPAPSPPTMGSNLRSGFTGSPAAKVKLLVMAIIAIGIIGVIAVGRKKPSEEVPAAETSRVAINEVDLADDDKGGASSNPEVDSLNSRTEKERQLSAIVTGDTYVAPVPDLDSAPKAAPLEEPAPVYVPATVSLSAQQAKLAALQGLDGKIAESKLGIVGETRFEKAQVALEPSGPGSSGEVISPGGTSGGSAADDLPVKKQYPAGTIWFATTKVAIDSDVPGPIKASIEQGPFAGGEVLGSYEVQGRKYVTMSFSKIVYEGTEYPINAIGLNPNNGVAGLEGDVNNHWGQRLILPTLAAAVGKYAEAATFGGVTSITSSGSIIQQPELSDSEKLQYALGQGVSEGVTPVIQEEANAVKRQVTLPQNTSFGLMLVNGL